MKNKDNNLSLFNDKINELIKSGEYKLIDYILVLLIGEHVKLTNLAKIKLIYYNGNINNTTTSFLENYKINREGLVKTTHIII